MSFRRALSTLILACVLVAARVGQAAPDLARDVWVEVRINNVPQPDFALLHIDLRGHLLARMEDVRAWRLLSSTSTGAAAGGLVRLDDFPGLHARLDADETLLLLDAEPSLFNAQFFAGGRPLEAPDRGVPAVFLGYNLFAEADGGLGTTYSALVQAGSSLGRASFTSSWLGSRIVADQSAASQVVANESSGWHRLDTALLLDFPEDTARCTLGDSVSTTGTLGDAVRFSGVHWATDYATRPGLTPYALPVISGTATMPSTVELYVNNALVQRTNVDAGPFQLNSIPVPVGEGSVDIRMRDMTGQLQQLSVPYLVSPQLVAAGLTTVDFEAGAVRENYGIADFDYGPWFVAGAVQHGLSNGVTVNAAAELLQDQLTARGGVVYRATRNITLDVTPAVSRVRGEGTGAAVNAGIDTQWSTASFGVHYVDASPAYRELGSLGPGERLRTQWAAQASTQLGPSGSLALLYALRHSYQEPTTAATTLTYNLSLRRLGALGVFVSNTRAGNWTGSMAGVTFTHYFGLGGTGGQGVTASVYGASDRQLQMQVGRPAPTGGGFGWDLAHANGDNIDTTGLRIDARSAYGTGSGEIDSTHQGTLGILSWQGGLLWAAGRPWPAQTLAGPAAVLVVPDLGGVEVLHDGQPVGRTDGAGRILVPSLRPFEDNTLTIVPEDVPVSALIDSDRISVRPYSHGVVTAVMPVAASQSQVFQLLLAPEVYVPPGAEIQLSGHSFPVGTQGLAQVPLGHEAADALVSWPGGRCKFHVPAVSAMKAGTGDAVVANCGKP